MPVDIDRELVYSDLQGCYNVVTNLRTAMSGSIMQLAGTGLDFNKSDVRQGLFLTDFAGNSTKIVTIVRIRPDNIIFMIPGKVRPGMYRLEMRKRSSMAESIQTSVLPGFIQVVV